MLTFTALGGPTVRVSTKELILRVFPEKGQEPSEKELFLLSEPDPEPKKSVLSWPGEYDTDGVAIRAIGQLEGKQVSYVADTEGMRCAYLSPPLQEWGDHDLELLGDIDILFIPAHKPRLLQTLVEEIDPRVLILVPTDGKIDPEVLRVCGAESVKPQSELKLKGSLPSEGREVIVLKA